MDQNNQLPRDFSLQQAMDLAKSPMGKQLLSQLQQRGGADFQNAMAGASSGDMEKTKQAVSAMLADPSIQELIRKFGG